MALPGDARIVIDVPPPGEPDRRATLTIGHLGGDCELGQTLTWTLDKHEESELNLMLAGIVYVKSCGPSA